MGVCWNKNLKQRKEGGEKDMENADRHGRGRKCIICLKPFKKGEDSISGAHSDRCYTELGIVLEIKTISNQIINLLSEKGVIINAAIKTNIMEAVRFDGVKKAAKALISFLKKNFGKIKALPFAEYVRFVVKETEELADILGLRRSPFAVFIATSNKEMRASP